MAKIGTDDERLHVDAAKVAEDRSQYVALPPVRLVGDAESLVSGLVKIIDEHSEEGRVLTGATIYTSCRGRYVRVTVQEVI